MRYQAVGTDALALHMAESRTISASLRNVYTVTVLPALTTVLTVLDEWRHKIANTRLFVNTSVQSAPVVPSDRRLLFVVCLFNSLA